MHHYIFSLSLRILTAVLLLLPSGIMAQDDMPALVVADTVNTDDDFYADTLFTDSLPATTADSLLTDSARQAQAAAHAQWKARTLERLNKQLGDPLFETAQLGMMVWDLTADSLLFAHGERQRLRPASTQKVVTAISALDRLGTDYTLKTRLCLSGARRDSSHTWQGALYVVGGMDPYLKQSDLRAMADSLRAMDIDTLTGGVYSDYSFRDSKPMGEGWCWDDKQSNPTLVPLTMNKQDNVASHLRQALREAGIKVEGGSYTGECPKDARLVCLTERPIATVMRPMLKNSNNQCAESIFYQLAHHEAGKGASAKQAARAVGRTLRKAGLDASRYEVADGSGLSLYNYASAEMEVRLLRYAYSKPDIFAALYPLLPVAGRDGTLRKRMRGTAAQGNVHAKTGTVTAVRTLAGYCTTSTGHVLAFALFNQGQASGSLARVWQDKVCQILCE